jgi:tRNA(fMet)-specific endonuclease VapC
MYLLDTDHISIFDRGGRSAQPLLAKLTRIPQDQITVTIVTYEEQMRGWLSYIAKATTMAYGRSETIEAQIIAYQKLEKQLINYRNINVISFDDRAGKVFQDLRKTYPRLGTMDLKIASIVIVNRATLLTRNTKDFGQIKNLVIEDWTI